MKTPKGKKSKDNSVDQITSTMPEVGKKRVAEPKDDEVAKKVKGVDITMRLLLLGKFGGLMVGKGGENLANLRTQHNVKLKMTPGRTSDRVLGVDGEMEDCISLAKEVLEKCPQAPYPVGQQTPSELNLLVSTDVIGMIIGKGGDKLKEIRDQSNGKVKVYQDCLPNSNERVVSIGGESEEVIAALSVILDVIKDAPRGSHAWYDPNNKPSDIITGGIAGSGITPTVPQGYQVQGSTGGNEFDPFQQSQTVSTLTIPNEICGAIIGKGGIRIREIRGSSGAKVEFSESDRVSNADRTVTISGTQFQVNTAEHLMAQCARNRTV